MKKLIASLALALTMSAAPGASYADTDNDFIRAYAYSTVIDEFCFVKPPQLQMLEAIFQYDYIAYTHDQLDKAVVEAKTRVSENPVLCDRAIALVDQQEAEALRFYNMRADGTPKPKSKEWCLHKHNCGQLPKIVSKNEIKFNGLNEPVYFITQEDADGHTKRFAQLGNGEAVDLNMAAGFSDWETATHTFYMVDNLLITDKATGKGLCYRDHNNFPCKGNLGGAFNPKTDKEVKG